MSELRQDPLTGRWVIIAAERAQRPQPLLVDLSPWDSSYDPFLEGHEEQTPPEILACRLPGTAPDTPGWRVRVVPNRFPALGLEGSTERHGQGLLTSIEGVGAHEVIIECPQFETHMARLSVDNIAEVLWAYRERLVDLQRDPRLVYPVIFKNEGVAAGASLAHCHSQLIVTPLVPPAIQSELERAREFYEQRKQCLVCEMVGQEKKSECRVALESSNFIVLCAFAGRFPYECWIVPTGHASHYETLTRQLSIELAAVLRMTLRKLSSALENPALNYVLRTTPFHTPALAYAHWRIEILPRSTGIAGFELGTGVWINPVPPEEAARILRETPEGN